MPQFNASDPAYKHVIEYFTNKIMRFIPTRTLAETIYQRPEEEYMRLVNLGTIKEPSFYVGSGVPALATVPNGGRVNDYYFRSDALGVAGTRIYVCTVAGSSTAIGTWVATAA